MLIAAVVCTECARAAWPAWERVCLDLGVVRVRIRVCVWSKGVRDGAVGLISINVWPRCHRQVLAAPLPSARRDVPIGAT